MMQAQDGCVCGCTKRRPSVRTFLKWASMSGLLSHISVRRTTDVWRTPAEQADGQRISARLRFLPSDVNVCAQGECEERQMRLLEDGPGFSNKRAAPTKQSTPTSEARGQKVRGSEVRLSHV